MVALQRKSGPFQPELTGFVIGFTSDLRPDALGLALYASVVVYEIFRVHHLKLRKARERTVLRHWETTCQLVEDLHSQCDRQGTLRDLHIETTEPFVLQYVVDALTEQNTGDPIELSDDEF